MCATRPKISNNDKNDNDNDTDNNLNSDNNGYVIDSDNNGYIIEQGALLIKWIRLVRFRFGAYVINYIHIKVWVVITHPFHNVNDEV